MADGRPQKKPEHVNAGFAGPPFSPAANSATRYILFAVGFFFIAGLWAWYAFARSDYLTQLKTPIDQPVLFSHRHHVGDLGIDCLYCHTSVEESAFAGIPSTETCMTCHSQLFTDSPMLEPVRESFASGKPIAWNRVHNLPEFVYFDHSIHVNKGVNCVDCHGDVADMPLISQQETLHMDWCLSCHRQHEPAASPHHPEITERSGPEPGPLTDGAPPHPINPLTNCYTCHR